MKKKGQIRLDFTAVFFLLIIVFFVLLISGGLSTVWKIGSFISKVPTWVWIIFILLFVFQFFGGKRR